MLGVLNCQSEDVQPYRQGKHDRGEGDPHNFHLPISAPNYQRTNVCQVPEGLWCEAPPARCYACKRADSYRLARLTSDCGDRPSVVSRAETYRHNADECRQQAERSRNAADKERWLKIAEHWLKLAQETEH